MDRVRPPVAITTPSTRAAGWALTDADMQLLPDATKASTVIRRPATFARSRMWDAKKNPGNNERSSDAAT